jgi:hypothetical protein
LEIRITTFRISGVLLYLYFLHPNDLVRDFLTTACNTLSNKPQRNITKFLNILHMTFPPLRAGHCFETQGHYYVNRCRCILDHALNNAVSLCRQHSIVVLYHLWRSFFLLSSVVGPVKAVLQCSRLTSGYLGSGRFIFDIL